MPRAWWPPRALIVGLVALAAAINLLLVVNPGYYYADDIEFLGHVRDRALGDLPFAPWTEAGVFYRPLAYNSLLLEFWAMGAHPQLVHLFDVSVVLASALLVARIAGSMSRDRTTGLFAGLLFACSPLTAAGAGWASAAYGRLGLLFLLVAAMLVVGEGRRPRGSTARALVVAAAVTGAVALALMCKEVALIAVPGVVVAAVHWRNSRAITISAVGVLALCAVYALFRYYAYFATELPGASDPQYSHSLGIDLLLRFTAYWAAPSAIGVHYLPVLGDLSHAPVAVALGVTAHLALVALLATRSWWYALGYVAAYCLPLLPVVGLPRVGVNYLFFSSVAHSVAVGILLVGEKRRWLRLVIVAITVATLAQGAMTRVSIFRDGCLQAGAFPDLESCLATHAAEDGVVHGKCIVVYERSAPHWIMARLLHQVTKIGRLHLTQPIEFHDAAATDVPGDALRLRMTRIGGIEAFADGSGR